MNIASYEFKINVTFAINLAMESDQKKITVAVTAVLCTTDGGLK